MSDETPITQDVLTIPRKAVPGDGRRNIVGLTRDGLKEALIATGTPEKQAKMRVNQIWQWVYHWGVRDFANMTNLAKAYRAELAEASENGFGAEEIPTKEPATEILTEFERVENDRTSKTGVVSEPTDSPSN